MLNMTPEAAIALAEARSSPVPETGCWMWLGATCGGKREGYAQVRVGVVRIMLCRAIVGILDQPHLVPLHACDVEGCVAPHHLRAGTPAENMQDMARKGRHPTITAGNACPRCGSPRRLAPSGRWTIRRCDTCNRATAKAHYEAKRRHR